MYITVTSLKLRSIWGFFKLSLYGLKITQQARTEKGFIGMKNTGFGLVHYTLSHWQNAEDLKRFAHSGQHLQAMKQSAKLSTEIRTYTYESGTMPQWPEAKKLLLEKGKLMKFE